MCSARWLIAIVACLCAVPYQCSAKNVTENVALSKGCNMSSYHPDMGQACRRAVNGDTSGLFLGTDNCVHTELGDKDPWFEVDLGRPYPIQSIVIFARSKYEQRMANVRVTVDDDECYVFPQHIERRSVINCTKPLSGQRVRVSKAVAGKADGDQTLNMCELQVFSCVEEMWGRGCAEQCGECAEGEGGCDKVTGHCVQCKAGMDPPYCVQTSDTPAVDPESEVTSAGSTRAVAVSVLVSACTAIFITSLH